MVTWANLIEFEHGVPKLTVAPPSAVVFGAGDALIANMLTERVVRAGTVHTVTDLANALSTQYAQMRQERAEADILMARGLNWAAFYGQHAQLQQPIVMMIDQALAQYNLGVELLAAGVDDSGAHLFTGPQPWRESEPPRRDQLRRDWQRHPARPAVNDWLRAHRQG